MANKQIRVLLVEDNPGDVRLIKELLSQEDAQKDGASFHLECAARLSTALERVSSGDIDVLLLDLGLPDSQGFDTYSRLHAQAPEVPIVVLTGLDDAALATRTVREGAQDYLAKSRLDSALLRRSIRYGIERKEAEKHIQHLNSVLRAIRDVNQLVVVEKDRASLFQKSCDALVEARGYDAAWLGFLKDGESFAIVAGSGPGEEASRIAEHLMRGEFPRCVRTMLAQEEKLLVFDKRRECKECPFRNAYAGSTTVIIRVEHGGRHFGLLVISLGTDIAADDEEQSLLTEVASDLAIGLRNIELEEGYKEAEETLRQSEKKYRLLAETARDIILTHDMQGRITYFNKAALEQAGYLEEEALQLSITDVVPANQVAQMKGRQPRRTTGGHGVSTYETEFLTKAGRRIPIEVGSSVIVKQGKPSGILIIARDIGERRRAEEALRKSEKKFRELADLLPQVVYETDARGNLTFTNRNGFDAFGYTQADFAKGLNTLQMLVHEDHPRARENFQRTLHGEEARGDEYKAVRKDGSTFPVALYSSPIIHEGEPVGHRGIIVDISERKQAEVALRHERDKAQKYLDVAGVMLVALNSEGEITLLNARGCQLLGCSEEEALGKNWFDLFMPERLRHDVRSVFAQLMAGQIEAVEYFENPVLTVSGEERLIAWHNNILTDSAGNIVGILSSGEDITDRKLAEEEVRQKTEDLALFDALNSAVNRGDTLQDILELLTRETKRIFSCDGATAYLLSDDGEHLVVQRRELRPAKLKRRIEKITGGAIPSEIRISLRAGGIYSEVLRGGAPRIINDPAAIQSMMAECTESKTLKKLVPAIHRIMGISSVLCTPLVSEGQAIGIVDMSRSEPFTESDVQRFEVLSQQLSALIGHKRADTALRESEARFRQMAEAIPAIFWISSGDGSQAEYVSPAFETIYGHSHESLYQESQLWLNAIHPEDRERVIAVMEEHRGQEREQEYRIVRPDGEVRWIHNRIVPVRGERGEVSHTVGLTQDITERKLAETALRKERDLVERLMETSPTSITVFDREQQMIFANAQAEQLLGLVKDETSGRAYVPFLLEFTDHSGHPIPNEELPLQRVMQTAQPVSDLRIALQRSGGPRMLLSVNAAPLFDEASQVEAVVLTIEDVTEQVRAHEALRRRDAILEAVSFSAERLLTATNWVDIIPEVSERLGKAAGVDRVFVRQRNDGLVPTFTSRATLGWRSPETAAMFQEFPDTTFSMQEHGFGHWEEALANGKAVWGDAQDFPAAEREYLIQRDIKSAAALPIFAGKQWWGFIGLDNLFSERQWSPAEIDALKTAASTLGAAIQRQQAEEEKTRLEAELRQALKMQAIGSLAGGVAHDFNNILTVIQGYTEFALMSIGEDDPVRRDLNEVRRASVRAANLTRQLLLFSRRQPMTMNPLNINQTVQDLTKMLGRLIGEEIALTTNLESDLWPIEGDSGTIEQVIMNLVVNSRDALPQGGEISIQTQNLHVDEEYCQTRANAQLGEFVCLSVTDTGTGIGPDIIDHIFEPFFTTKEPGKGTGMGLSVVYGIVKQHEGWIDVESSPGEGSTFRVYLPATSTPPTQEQEPSVSTEVSRGKGERILLVEDEESIRDFAFRGLSEHGYVVYPAANVQEALDVFQDNDGDFDLIFNDLVLPDGSGLKLAHRLLDLRPDTKVIFASGYSADKEDWHVIHEEGHPFLQKPYSLSDLLGAVREVLG